MTMPPRHFMLTTACAFPDRPRDVVAVNAGLPIVKLIGTANGQSSPMTTPEVPPMIEGAAATFIQGNMMDDQRFDLLTKSLSAGFSRRRLLQGITGAISSSIAISSSTKADPEMAKGPTSVTVQDRSAPMPSSAARRFARTGSANRKCPLIRVRK